MFSPKAKWISDPDRGELPNYTFLARRAFPWEMSNGSEHTLRIAADSRYILYVNGARLGAGPARSSQKRFFYDSYEIARHLRQGINHVAVEVYCPVQPNYTAVPIAPALWLQIDDWLETDSDWQVLRDPSRETGTPLFTFQMGYSEWRDLRLHRKGWTTFSDQAEGWRKAEIVGTPENFGGRALVARDIPMLAEAEFGVQKLVASGAVPYLPPEELEGPGFAELVHSELHFQAELPIVEQEGKAFVVRPSVTRRGAYAVFDFQREMVGRVRLKIDAPSGTIIDIAYGESLNDNRILTQKSFYRFADRFTLDEGLQEIEALHDRGFRYLQLVFRSFERPVFMHAVKVLDRRYPIARRASFQSSDSFLNRLWHMCDETISACSLDTFIDCPWREQVLWLNDVLVVGLFYSCLTGDKALAARSLRVGVDGQDSEGVIPVAPPSSAEKFSSIPAFLAVILHDYLLYTGDAALVRELLPSLDRGLSTYRKWRNEEGLIPDQNHLTNFIDWAYSADTAELGGTSAILNLLIAAGFKFAGDLYTIFGAEDRAAELKAESHDLVRAIQHRFWNQSSRRLVDCTHPPLGRPSSSQHSHAVGLYFDLLPEIMQEGALDALSDPSVLEAELYFQHFVISSLAQRGQEKEALQHIRDLWGEMVSQGAVTVWESKAGSSAFEGCGSLCHAFSCTPLYFTQSVLLGIKPRLPGFREFEVNPRGVGLDWCKGTVPTPHGFIEVEWTNKGGELELLISVPEMTVGVLADGRRLEAGQHRVFVPQPEEAEAREFQAA